MRGIIARCVSAVAASVVVALSVLFAWRHNPPPPRDAGRGISSAPGSRPMTEAAERGRRVFADQNCASCHSIAGVGNPRFPLDQAGAHRRAEELRDWITATGDAGQKLPAAVVRRKSQYRTLTDEELNGLTAYIVTAREKP